MRQSKKITRRQFLKVLLPFAVVIGSGIACLGDEAEQSERRTKKRNKWLKRTGRDKVKDGDGKGWGDEYGKDKKSD